MYATPKVSSVAIRHPRLFLCPHLPSWLNLPSLKLWPFVSVCSVVFFFLYFLFVMVKLKVIVASVCLCSLSFKYLFHLSSVNIEPEYAHPLKLLKVVFSSHTECQCAIVIRYLFVILNAYSKRVIYRVMQCKL